MGAADLADALAAAGISLRRYRAGRHRTCCPSCGRGPRDDALGVTIDDEGAAVWHCFRCELAGCWRPRDRAPERPAKAKHASHSAKEMHASGLSDYGRRIVAEAKPVTAGDLAGRHLFGRCCALPSNDVLFHPSVWHPQQKRAYPAMVAVITDILTVEPISLHFTFLDPAGGGKAKIEQPRRYLYGHRKVGVVRLTPDHEITQGLVLGEGLETCLSYALEYSEIWACLDAGNLGAFPVLPGIEGLTVLIDNDEAGHRAFGTVRDRYRAAGLTHPLDIIGIEVKGKPGDDINDLVRTA